MRRGFVYRISVIDGYRRKVLSWRLSNTMSTNFCLDAVHKAFSQQGKPEIFNTGQGRQGPFEQVPEFLQYPPVAPVA